ncbi:MAG: TetR family transcriptional regulator [Burkholderiales bacterium]|nr:TetR family transcriptional regulator [Burkholderiales bacterium]
MDIEGTNRTRTRAPAKSKRDPERTRARILEAATAEFTRHGLGGARVDRIAKRAGTNERMLYYYFLSKDQLFLTVLESVYIRLAEAEKALELDHLEPVEAVRKLVEFIWNYYILHPEFISLINTENLHEAKYLKKSRKLAQLVSPVQDNIRAIVQRGQEAGVFRGGIDPAEVYITLVALNYYYLSNRHTLSTVLARDLMSPVARERHLEHATEVVMNYLLKARPA